MIRPDGKRGIYSFVETPGPGVFIVPLTDRNEIFLIRLYRYPTKQFSWEIPGGNAGRESPLVAAKRELKEETGLVARHWEKIGTTQLANGIASEIDHVFLARHCQDSRHHKQEEEGIGAMKKVPLPHALQMIEKGEITDGQTIVALFFAAVRFRLSKAHI